MREMLVTGIGPVSALGIGRAAWAARLRAGARAPGAIEGFALAEILPSMKTYTDRASAFTLAACQLALADAGLAPGAYDRWRAGIVVGSVYGCLPTLYTYTAALQHKGARFANPLLFSHTYVNTPASLAAIEFGLGGHHGTFTGEHAGLQALEAAREALALDRADLLLAVGVDAISEPLTRAREALGADEPLGEGACALVLETADYARARGAAGLPLPEPVQTASLRSLLGDTLAAEPFFAVAAALARNA
ncbi:MAG TPA: beta-ketoacyl synthase N-terminal-like domain-containing protein [Armatimonadota bacterium]|nr:beta-ketoacyl synthase N-terminal-like domain-containing protein [Armatimonadota bacterium]HOS43166.1 beta-ketoacyl synthase N-terminal-like domain-containing protein [Armatimonadota bacterium]